MDSICVEIAKAIDSESWELEDVNLKALMDTINYAEDIWPEWAVTHALLHIGTPNDGLNI